MDAFDIYMKMVSEDLLFNADDGTKGGAEYYVNPSNDEMKIINAQGGNARGVITNKGNLVLVTPKGALLHRDIINFLISKGVLKSDSSWLQAVGTFIGIKQEGTALSFVLADSYPQDFVSKNQQAIQSIFNAVKAKVGKNDEGKDMINSKCIYKMELSKDNS